VPTHRHAARDNTYVMTSERATPEAHDSHPAPVPPDAARWTLWVALGVVGIGAIWLLALHSAPWPAVIFGALPSALLLSTGVGALFFGDDARVTQTMAGGAFAGLVLAPLMAIWLGALTGFVLFVLALAALLAAGFIGPAREPTPAEIPQPAFKLHTIAETAADELGINFVVFSAWPLPAGPRMDRIGREVRQGLDVFTDKGWLTQPKTYHRAPPPLDDPQIGVRTLPQRHEHMQFTSGYEPWPDEPGRDRWLGYRANRTAHARILRHRDPHPDGNPRDWMIFIHGLKMGTAPVDFFFLRPGLLHQQWGLNIACPILPLHGPRCFGINSGARAVNGDFLDTMHLAAQAVWDIRRLLAWVRARNPGARVGMLGYSLGGYTAALLSGLVDEGELDWVVAGSTAVDLVGLFERFAPSALLTDASAGDWDPNDARRLLTAASPMAITPHLPADRLGLFAGTTDRITPPPTLLPLWEHWQRPQLVWHDGGHLRFLRSAAACEMIRAKTAREAG